MNTILDLAGSYIVGGIIIVSITALTFYFTGKSQDHKLSEISQRAISDIGSIIEYDINRLGYRVTDDDKIISINDSTLVFLADLDNNGIVDTVSYSKFTNSGVKLFKRRVAAASSSEWTNPIDSISIKAFTSDGSATSNTDSINSISVMLLMKEKTNNDDYTAAQWQRQFYPKNL